MVMGEGKLREEVGERWYGEHRAAGWWGWKGLWFDLKCNAKGHFEAEEICTTWYWSLGPVATMGVIASGGSAILDGLFKVGGGPLGKSWVTFIQDSPALRAIFPYFAFGSLAALGCVLFCEWKARAIAHHVAGVKYMTERNEHSMWSGTWSECELVEG